MKRPIFAFSTLVILMLSAYSFAQEKVMWTQENPGETTKLLKREGSVSDFKIVVLDVSVLRDQLNKLSKNNPTHENAITIKFPDANGNLLPFSIKETSILHPDLAAKYPTIKTYSGQGVNNKSSNIYFTLNSLGLYAMILSSDKGITYIDPYTEDREKYMVYLKKDATTNRFFQCLTKNELPKTTIKGSTKNANDLTLRTFRLALATTEEYSNFHVDAAGVGAGSSRNDSINAVMSALTVSMTRVNPLFERDVALTMQLVANNDQLIFLETDPGNDPYSNNNGIAMLGQNQTTVDNIIGTANYDIGHVFSTGGGGVASLNSPCGSLKAQGVTGSTSPVGDTFDVDLVAHEMGHQFGANHTFNGTASNCNGNRNNNTAVEPGSGSTIMAYAGICAPQNVQSNSDAYFHTVSIQEMFNNITIGASQCAVQTNFINNMNAPTVDAGSDFTVPKTTPFKLVGQGSDEDMDMLSYTWEQINNEVSAIQIPPSSTQTEGAVFRSLSPTNTPIRYMPPLLTVLSGSTSSTWEVVPSVSRTLNFDLTLRDNAIGEGQTVSDDMVVTVNADAGPFVVTSQSVTGITWTEGSTETITWDVAGTDANGVNVSNVNILLSLNGGQTFSEILVSNTPNDGSEQITVPNQTASNVRVMVEAVNNIFYAINSESFSIGSFETICTVFDPVDVPLAIPDNTSTGVSSIVNVPDNFVITDLDLKINITHTWLWDLQIYLTAPDGSELLVYDRSCGSSGLQRQDINATFDDDAPSVICTSSIPAVSGDTKPDNLLSVFNGLPSQGNWTLRVVDNAPNDIGTLNAWSLKLCTDEPTASVDDSSFDKFLIYPNPFKNTFTLSLNSKSSDDVLVALHDLSGRLIMNKKYSNLGIAFEKELNFNNLASGVYILSVRRGIAKASKKIVKY